MSKHCIGIVGTDTDVGKTLFTALLAKCLNNMSKKTLILKAIQTGCNKKNSANELIAPDLEKYRDVDSKFHIASCYQFEPACSPHLACVKDGKYIYAASLVADIMHKIEDSNLDICLLEGAGGLMTPINTKETFADVFLLLSKKIELSLILVINNKLGALNHALLTYEKIKCLNIPIFGYVFNEAMKNDSKNILDNEIKISNRDYLKQYFSSEYLGSMPYNNDTHSPNYERRQSGYHKLCSFINAEYILNNIQDL